MSDKKHIDRIFQEKLKDLEVSPGANVWDNISQELGRENNRRKVIPIWWKLIGAAAIIVLLFAVGNLIFNQNIHIQNMPVIVESEDLEESNTELVNESLIDPEEEISRSIVNPEETPNNNPEANKSLVESGPPTNNKSETESESNKIEKGLSNTSLVGNSTIITNQENEVDNIVSNKTTNPSEAIRIRTENDVLKEALNENSLAKADKDNNTKSKENKPENIISNKAPEELIIEQEKEKIPLTEEVIVNNEEINEEEEKNINRWQVSPNIAPVYFNSFGNGSSINEQLVYNKKSGEINVSYGVNVSYAISERLSLKSGVNRVNLGYSTNDIIIYENVNASAANSRLFRNIKLNSAVQSFSFVSGSNFGFVQSPSVIPGESMAFLNQDMTFYEIPVELKYRLSDKKVGFSLIGGFSTLFLSDNQVSYEFRGENTVLGEAINLNDVSYSANFGFGLDYRFARNMSFTLDPTFKYQINTFNNTSGSFKPYFIGVYSGINIKF